ncbi:MAG: 5-(carboxyamino)imidazole ribonucleotide mutase [Actinobacteria bacterium]|nr:MAG: 5-(carboxyamino)imidazole ribonucleotide mutase [Actinomycetota bacterium]
MAKVAIVMGSKSDLKVMEPARLTLQKFKIKSEERIISAHRNPDKLVAYVREAEKKGIEVFIAGAGKAAHLPGVIAAHTSSPVIGVPVETSDLGGMDSLLSIVQMPRGVPVATVAINGSQNAALLAVQILSIKDKELKKKFEEYKKSLAEPPKKKTEEKDEEPIIDG